MKKIISLFIAFVMFVSIPTIVYSADEIYTDDTNVAFSGEYGKINITLKYAKEYSAEDFSYIPVRMVIQKYPKRVEVYITEKSKTATDAAIDSISKAINDNITSIEGDYTLAYISSGDIPGDASGDYLLNLSDVSLMLKYIAGWNTPVHYTANVNNDKIVNLTDVSITLKRIAGWDEDNICLKKPTDEFIRQIETELEAYHADQDGHLSGINYAVEIYRYYGTYNDAVVIYYEGGGLQYSQALWIDYVAGYEFSYGDGNCIMLWKDGILYNMNQAYEERVLTKEQVKKIAELHRYGGYISYK